MKCRREIEKKTAHPEKYRLKYSQWNGETVSVSIYMRFQIFSSNKATKVCAMPIEIVCAVHIIGIRISYFGKRIPSLSIHVLQILLSVFG